MLATKASRTKDMVLGGECLYEFAASCRRAPRSDHEEMLARAGAMLVAGRPLLDIQVTGQIADEERKRAVEEDKQRQEAKAQLALFVPEELR